jgi:hypothetical protein
MRGVRWKYILPAVMLVLALACHIYDPHEYRVTSLRDRATSNLSYFGQHFPVVCPYDLRQSEVRHFSSNGEVS